MLIEDTMHFRLCLINTLYLDSLL